MKSLPLQRIDEMKLLRLSGMTLEAIGNQYGVTRERVRQILLAPDSSLRRISLCGACKKPFLYFGHSRNFCNACRVGGLDLLTGRDFVRELVRARDGHRCAKCRERWIVGNRRFDVHHLNGFCGKKSRHYDKREDMPGLITLCHKCHFSLHKVREKMRGRKSLIRKRHLAQIPYVLKTYEQLKSITATAKKLDINYTTVRKIVKGLY